MEIIRYNEPLNEHELGFLRKKEAKERKQYYFVFRILMFMSFLFPFIGSWYRAYDGAPNAFSYPRFFITTTILLSISGYATYASYRAYHRKLRLDLRQKTKTIETQQITKKVIIPGKDAFYFYTRSIVKMSIEVSEEYYHSLKEGDEVSIEYTTHSHMYLGYF